MSPGVIKVESRVRVSRLSPVSPGVIKVESRVRVSRLCPVSCLQVPLRLRVGLGCLDCPLCRVSRCHQGGE